MAFGGSGGGNTRVGSKVYLNVYDLTPANDYLYAIGCGLHHSGIELDGVEWSFASGAGVFDGPPKIAPGARFREQVELGNFLGTSVDVRRSLDDLRDNGFGPDDYNLIRKNCNHFANAFCWKLLRKTIPGYVNRMADLGVCCSCLLPRTLLEHAPVGDPRDANKGFTAFPPSRQAMARSAFSGSGARLGGSEDQEHDGLLSRFRSTPHQANAAGTEDAADRREKARRAALARLEQSQESKNQ